MYGHYYYSSYCALRGFHLIATIQQQDRMTAHMQTALFLPDVLSHALCVCVCVCVCVNFRSCVCVSALGMQGESAKIRVIIAWGQHRFIGGPLGSIGGPLGSLQADCQAAEKEQKMLIISVN